MNEYIVALASTAWRGWADDEGDELSTAEQCIEIALRDCGVGWIEVLFRGDISELEDIVSEAIYEAQRRNLPLTWQFQDLCYAEPMDADEIRLRLANWLKNNAVTCDHCGTVTEPNYAYSLDGIDDEQFCSEWCAEEAYHSMFPAEEEIDA